MDANYEKVVKRFKNELETVMGFEKLFEYLPDINFYVKDEFYKLIMCNESALRLFSLKKKSDFIGKSEYDFFPKKMADPIHADDVYVMENKRPIINRMELIVDENKIVKWVLSTKIPLIKKNGTIGGLMGTTRIISNADMIPSSFKKHAKALAYIKNHYNQQINIADLASMCALSISQFRKTFSKRFSMSPQTFILKIRVQVACKELTNGVLDIAEIAQKCGFCDQSYFTRQFRAHVGMTPMKYRASYSSSFC